MHRPDDLAPLCMTPRKLGGLDMCPARRQAQVCDWLVHLKRVGLARLYAKSDESIVIQGPPSHVED